MCANSKFLNETLRNTWGFDGYVTSDCDAVGDVYTPGQTITFGSEAFSSLKIQKRHLDIEAKWSNFGRFVVCEFDEAVLFGGQSRRGTGTRRPWTARPWLSKQARIWIAATGARRLVRCRHFLSI
eukprot:COSAG04_NODE_5686_length_1526_cov_2.276104_2_plen_125_part_00